MSIVPTLIEQNIRTLVGKQNFQKGRQHVRVENPQFNYIVDIYGKWYHKAFYFCADYRVAGPNPIEPGFEAKFARLQYAGNRRFHLSFMRYTGQWIRLYWSDRR